MQGTQQLINICLIIVGFINLLPVLGVFSVSKLSSAYGIELDSDELIVLMRHRALLFGILGGYILISVFLNQYQTSAMLMALISMLGFALLFWDQGHLNTELNKIFWADIVGLIFLLAAIGIRFLSPDTSS